SDGPSWIDLAEIRVNTTESRFVTCLNRLLQQNRSEAAELAPRLQTSGLLLRTDMQRHPANGSDGPQVDKTA
ncbi:hypothetical protein, partial [Bradyrhizobium sp. 197]|uniref:hypothetical protein n=1 Tax=Bradyrhizobium sp. 197 TaxID=2782663 RepID=UPI001FF8720E